MARGINGPLGGLALREVHLYDAIVNTLWNELATKGRITLTDQQEAALRRYLDLLIDANQRMNLTRITDPAATEVQHVGDALTLLAYLPDQPFTLADVGSGGGVPGLPIAIARPDARVALIESTKKKAAYLRDAVKQLQLQNVVVMDERSEEVARSNRRESFDVVTARAVGALSWLAEWCLPLVKVGGCVLAMKGERVFIEVPEAQPAIKLLGGGDATIHPVQLPGAEHHVIVQIPKIAKTSAKYPRNPTATRGKPLG